MDARSVVPALGGPERKVAEIFELPLLPLVGGSRRQAQYLHPPYLAWAPNGSSLGVCDSESVKDPAALFRISLETGERQKLTNPPAHLLGDCSPAFSPDGRTLAFSRSIDWGLSDLYLLEISDGLLGNSRTTGAII